MSPRELLFPLGAAVTNADIEKDPHRVFALLRSTEPVSWVPAVGAWVVTRRDLAIAMMRDHATFTVDDPRFSTAQVLGPSMLSLDGAEHARHRDPFSEAWRLPAVRQRFTQAVEAITQAMLVDLAPAGRAELRRDLAGPLAVRVMALALQLIDGDPDTLLGWYDDIVAAVTAASQGELVGDSAPAAVTNLDQSVRRTIATGHGQLADASTTLSIEEVVSNTGVLLFGGIETSEGMTTNAFAHLLLADGAWESIVDDSALIANAIEESLRLEPSVVRIDRFATRDAAIGEASIKQGEFVIISLAGANRDPSTFPDPDRFVPTRDNANHHVTFVHGPHSCLGMHLARLETRAAINAAVDTLPGLRLDPDAATPGFAGAVFRKPPRLDVVWDHDRHSHRDRLGTKSARMSIDHTSLAPASQVVDDRELRA